MAVIILKTLLALFYVCLIIYIAITAFDLYKKGRAETFKTLVPGEFRDSLVYITSWETKKSPTICYAYRVNDYIFKLFYIELRSRITTTFSITFNRDFTQGRTNGDLEFTRMGIKPLGALKEASETFYTAQNPTLYKLCEVYHLTDTEEDEENSSNDYFDF